MEAAAKIIYNTIKNRHKEQNEMILEPLQAMIQLAALSFYPTGTKLSITNNILVLQEPSWSQAIIRSYNSDKKDDLIYLFSVIKRFHLFYSFLLQKDFTSNALFKLLIFYAKKGVDKLIQTYCKTDRTYLTQTLFMYKTLLDTPDAFNMNLEPENQILTTQQTQNIEKIYIDDSGNQNEYIIETIANANSNGNGNANSNANDNSNSREIDNETEYTNYSDKSNKKSLNIDNVFSQIVDMYTDMHYNVIYNNFNLMIQDKENYNSYIDSINYSLYPVNCKITKWINENLRF